MIANPQTKRVLIWAAIIAAVIAGFWLGWRYWAGDKNVPEEFLEARREAAFVAERIVFLAHQSLGGLEQIGGLDETKRYGTALRRVEEELERNRQARDEALLLSSHLGTMAAYLAEIKPTRAQAAATEALGYEVSLVNRLINFHGLLTSLFELLENKFTGRLKNGDGEVKKLIAEINKEIKAINNFNIKFNELMRQFDEIYEK